MQLDIPLERSRLFLILSSWRKRARGGYCFGAITGALGQVTLSELDASGCQREGKISWLSCGAL